MRQLLIFLCMIGKFALKYDAPLILTGYNYIVKSSVPG